MLDEHSKSLQGRDVTLDGTFAAVTLCSEQLQMDRDSFSSFFQSITADIEDLGLSPIEGLRQQKPPARFCGHAEAHVAASTEDFCRTSLFTTIDCALGPLATRFASANESMASFLI